MLYSLSVLTCMHSATLTKNWDNRAHVAQACDLSSMHASMFGLRACLNFFGHGKLSSFTLLASAVCLMLDISCGQLSIVSNFLLLFPSFQPKVDRGYRMPPPPGCPEPFYQIMMDCWKKDEMDRPTFEYLKYRLEDYFVSSEGPYKPIE